MPARCWPRDAARSGNLGAGVAGLVAIAAAVSALASKGCPLLTHEEKRELIALSAERDRRRQERKLFEYRPYPKQLEFHAAGIDNRERLLMAGNQLGKTWCAGFEVAMHLTGEYPEAGEHFYPTREELLRDIARCRDPRELMGLEGLLENLGLLGLFGADIYPNGWPGVRFNRPVWWWVASVAGASTRDNPQRILLGPPSNEDLWGTGAIPKANLLKNGRMRFNRAVGTPNLLDTVLVRHKSGGDSILGMKTYEQGRERWQGPTLDGIWYDEEPPADIYEEGLTRTNTGEGPNMLTFTPLLGMSTVVRLYISTEDEAVDGLVSQDA